MVSRRKDHPPQRREPFNVGHETWAGRPKVRGVVMNNRYTGTYPMNVERHEGKKIDMLPLVTIYH